MPLPAITVENLSKVYRIGLKEEIPDSLVGAIQGILRAPWKNFRRLRRLNTFSSNGHADAEDTIWALKDVSFEVAQGEVVGIIGRNGAGKSTLLKILSRITEPTSGRAVIRGRVSSLLEVGTGFHPELSGRENVYLNGTILGMTKREIDRKFDQIVDFSGVEKFLDTPVKRYSSGMQVRLAFAVAAHLEPEILIVDEVLAVGDVEFQKKCLGKMQDVAKGGRTVLFVSHNLGAIQQLCNRGVLLRMGELEVDAEIATVVDKYITSHDHVNASSVVDLRTSPRRLKSSVPMMEQIRLTSDGCSVAAIATGDALEISVSFSSPKALSRPALGVAFKTLVGERVGCLNNKFMKAPRIETTKTIGTVSCVIPELLLLPGEYVLDLYFGDRYSDYDIIDGACSIVVNGADFYGTGTMPPRGFGSWAIRASWGFSDEFPVAASK